MDDGQPCSGYGKRTKRFMLWCVMARPPIVRVSGMAITAHVDMWHERVAAVVRGVDRQVLLMCINTTVARTVYSELQFNKAVDA